MNTSDLCYGYALALSSLSIEEKKQAKYKNDSLLMIESLESNETFLDIVNSHMIPKEERIKIIEKTFKGITKNLVSILCILSLKGRSFLILKILRLLISYINDHLEINEGIVYSPISLLPKEVKKIEKIVGEMTGVTPALKNKIDKNLIAGIRVEVGDEIIDTSYKNQIHLLKKQLLRGGK